MKRTLPKRGLRQPALVPGYSMDAIDRASFRAGPPPLAGRAQNVKLQAGAAQHPEAPPLLRLDGTWKLAEAGDAAMRIQDDWPDAIPAEVPGSVHAALEAAGHLPDQTVGRNQEIAREASFKTWWFRKTFPRPDGTGPFRLVFDGVAVHCAVWLNGRKLGEHEGMFGGPSFDVTDRLAERNTLVVRIDPAPLRMQNGRNIGWRDTVVFNNVYGWHYSECPSLGIWRSVRVESSPAVAVEHPFIAARDTEGNAALAVRLAGRGGSFEGTLQATIEPDTFRGQSYRFAVPVRSRTRSKAMHLRFRIPAARLWWPLEMGEQALYRMTLSFIPSGNGNGSPAADTVSFSFGLRTIEMRPLPGGPRPDKYNWTFVINGQPMFVKGTGWCTMDPLMDFSRERYDCFLSLARDQHCQMIRAWGSGMPETDDFYDLCDRYGIMVLQEWPTAWNSHLDQPYPVLEETVRLNTLRLRNRPSLVMWGANNESNNPFGRAIDMMGRLSIELDGTRPFHRGEPWGGSRHNYASYWGRRPLDAHLTQTADFYGEFGLACMPVYESVQRYLPDAEKDRWPAPPDGAFAYHTPIFNTADDLSRLTQFARYFVPRDGDMEAFTVGSQLAQVVCLRHQLERARTRWPACTGALYYKMNDNFPAASWATADWYGAPKIGHYFVQDAFAPVHTCVLFDSVNNVGTPLDLPVFLLDDTGALDGKPWRVTVRACNGALAEIKRAQYRGKGPVTGPLEVGRFKLSFEETDTVPLLVVAEVHTGRRRVDRTFYWVNYEHRKGCLFELPATRLRLERKRGGVEVTNTGRLPAVGVELRRPGYADRFRGSDNVFWLDAGESQQVQTNMTDGLRARAWNARDTRVRSRGK